MHSTKWLYLALLLVLFLTLAGAASLRADDKAAADLALVPADAPGFISADFTRVWNDDIVKELLKKLEGAGQNAVVQDLEKHLGIELKQIGRITIIMPSTLANNDSPVVIISTVKPLDKEKVQKALTPDGTEKKSASGKAYIEDKKAVIHFAGDSTLIVGDPKPAIAYLDRKLDGNKDGRFKGAADLVAKNTLVALMDLSDYGKKLQEELPPLKGADALFDAKPALLTVTGDKDLTLTAKLTFKDEDQAKSGEKAAMAALDQLLELIIKGQKDLAKDLDNPELKKNELAQWGLTQATSLLKEFEDNVKKAEIAQKGKELSVVVHSKASAARVLTLALGMMTSVPGEKKSDPVPPKSK